MAAPTHAMRQAMHKRIMGGRFCFRSDSDALLGLVEAAYGGHAQHRFPEEGPEIDVELDLLPGRASADSEPPPLRSRVDQTLLYGIMDDRNYVLVSPGQRRAWVVASADMLGRAYHLRHELIEFAVFLLAARCQGLVPLHAACVGHGGRGILILGNSGAGKSTLALYSLLMGLDFLSEDAVFVQSDGMLATGVANFLHVRADVIDGIDDAGARRWVSGSPVIRRRSGVEKFEVDLQRPHRPLRFAQAPVEIVATVVLSERRARGPRASLTPMAREDVAACLAADQAYAMAQPGWNRFKRRVMRAGVHSLRRGRDPGSSVDALRRLLG